MIKNEERIHSQGEKRAYCKMLTLCLHELDDHQRDRFSWIEERQSAIEALRELCSEFGDNKWSDDLYMADIIRKHLGRHLE